MPADAYHRTLNFSNALAALLKAGRGAVLRHEASGRAVGHEGDQRLSFAEAEAFRALCAPDIPQLGVRLGTVSGDTDGLSLVAVVVESWQLEYRLRGAYDLNPLVSDVPEQLRAIDLGWREASTRTEARVWMFQAASSVVTDRNLEGRIWIRGSGVQWIAPSTMHEWPVIRLIGDCRHAHAFTPSEYQALETFLEDSLVFL